MYRVLLLSSDLASKFFIDSPVKIYSKIEAFSA